MLRISGLLMVGLLVLRPSAIGQRITPDVNAWSNGYIEGDISEKLAAKGQIAIRRADFINRWQQFIIRPSLYYQVTEQNRLGIGYSFSLHYPRKTNNKPHLEHNVFQDLITIGTWNSSKLQHRFRLEERFIKSGTLQEGSGLQAGFKRKNRLRYRLKVQVPVNPKMKNHQWGIVVFNELFLNLNTGIVPKSLSQNWSFAGMWIQFNRHWKAETGLHHAQEQVSINDHDNTSWESSLTYTL